MGRRLLKEFIEFLVLAKEAQTFVSSTLQNMKELVAAVCLVTFPNEDVAKDIIAKLLSQSLIACGNLVPGVLSLYTWQGKVTQDREVLAVLKTRPELCDKIEQQLQTLHPYEVHEFIVLESLQVSKAYSQWIGSVTIGND